jgi:hypothetical protein
VNDTVAVALITSLSTLTGAGLASTASAWVTGRQLRHQRELAHEERAERRTVAHRETSRDAYEEFLSRTDAAYRVLDERWFAARFDELPGRQAGFAVRRALDEAFVRVQLAGPGDVAETGAEVVRSVGAEFRLHARIVNSSPSATRCAAELDPTARADALRARSTSTTGFVTSARQALGGEISPTDDPADV